MKKIVNHFIRAFGSPEERLSLTLDETKRKNASYRLITKGEISALIHTSIIMQDSNKLPRDGVQDVAKMRSWISSKLKADRVYNKSKQYGASNKENEEEEYSTDAQLHHHEHDIPLKERKIVLANYEHGLAESHGKIIETPPAKYNLEQILKLLESSTYRGKKNEGDICLDNLYTFNQLLWKSNLTRDELHKILSPDCFVTINGKLRIVQWRNEYRIVFDIYKRLEGQAIITHHQKNEMKNFQDPALIEYLFCKYMIPVLPLGNIGDQLYQINKKN